MSTPKQLQILRTLDKADRMKPEDVFDLLTKGRLDKSGDFTKGCELDNAQALVLTGFVFSAKNPLIMNRLLLMEALETKIIDEKTQKTAWDQVLEWFVELPDPKNLAWILDDIVEAFIKSKQTI